MTIRKPAVAGQFYPAQTAELKNMVAELLKKAQEQEGEKISKLAKLRLYGLIVPHAGYVYSGLAMASAYLLLEKKKFDTYIMLGTNHTGLASDIAISMQDFETPLGISKNDTEFSKALLHTLDTTSNEHAHAYEHSIEVELPFLQYLSPEARIVPIIVATHEHGLLKKIAETISLVAEQMKRKICIIASSDFTHYGLAYGFVPFGPNALDAQEKIKELDMKAVKAIEKLNSRLFLEQARNTMICGSAPIALAIEVCKLFGASHAELLSYYTSASVIPDTWASVSYASLAFLQS